MSLKNNGKTVATQSTRPDHTERSAYRKTYTLKDIEIENTEPKRLWLESYPLRIPLEKFLGRLSFRMLPRNDLRKIPGKAEQMSALGKLCRRGHEIRNSLTSVRGFLQLVKIKPRLGNWEYMDTPLKNDRAMIITEFHLPGRKTTSQPGK